MTPLNVGFSILHIGGFYPSYMELRRKGGRVGVIESNKIEMIHMHYWLL
jgi:hypothetical protein